MDQSNARAHIEAASRKFAAALGGGDFEGAAALYSEQGQVLPPDGRPVSGRAGIAAFWEGAVAALGLKSAELRTLEVHSAGDLATEIGEARLELASGTAMVKYMVLWQRGVDGTWRLHRDIWNGSPA